jgi:hypothetical protein
MPIKDCMKVFQQGYGEGIVGKSLIDLFRWFFINAKCVGFRCAFQWPWLTIVMGLEIHLELSWGLNVYIRIIFL